MMHKSIPSYDISLRDLSDSETDRSLKLIIILVNTVELSSKISNIYSIYKYLKALK